MEMNELKSEVLDVVAGGQTCSPDAGHWQDIGVSMGTAFIGYHNNHTHLWYRLAPGDTLSEVAGRFGVTMEHIAEMNPGTIQNFNEVYAGDTLVVKRDPSQWELNTYPHFDF